MKGQSGRVNNSSHSGAVSRTIRETPVDLSHERDSHDLSKSRLAEQQNCTRHAPNDKTAVT